MSVMRMRWLTMRFYRGNVGEFSSGFCAHFESAGGSTVSKSRPVDELHQAERKLNRQLVKATIGFQGPETLRVVGHGQQRPYNN